MPAGLSNASSASSSKTAATEIDLFGLTTLSEASLSAATEKDAAGCDGVAHERAGGGREACEKGGVQSDAAPLNLELDVRYQGLSCYS